MPPIPQPVVMIPVTWPQGEVMLPELAREVGEEQAAHVYQLLVEDVVLRLRGHAGQLGARLVYYAGPVQNMRQVSVWLNDGQPPVVDAAPAVFGSEVEKLKDAVQQSFALLRAPQVVVVQPTAPELEPQDVVRALELLKEHEVVLGQTVGGGVYLVAARQPVPVGSGRAEELEESLRGAGFTVESATLPVRRAVGATADVKELPEAVKNRLRQLADFRQVEVPLLG